MWLYFVFATNCFQFLTRAATLGSFLSRRLICLVRAISKSILFFTFFYKTTFQVRILVLINRMPKSPYINSNKILFIIILVEIHSAHNIDGSKLIQSPWPPSVSFFSVFITIMWPYLTKSFAGGLYADIYIFSTPCFFRSSVTSFLFSDPPSIIINLKILCLQKISS